MASLALTGDASLLTSSRPCLDTNTSQCGVGVEDIARSGVPLARRHTDSARTALSRPTVPALARLLPREADLDSRRAIILQRAREP